MFDRFRYKFMQFMQGRYGADKFSQFLSGVILVLIILELIFRNPLLWWLSLILLIYMYFRMFSRNIAKRYNENRKYLEISGKIRNSRFGCAFGNGMRSLSGQMQNLGWSFARMRRRERETPATISINARSADRRSEFPEERAGSWSAVRNAARSLRSIPEKHIIYGFRRGFYVWLRCHQ